LVFAKRMDILCGPLDLDVQVVSTDVEGLPCNSNTNVRVALHPVDIGDFECEDLSLNGRQSFFFDADRTIVLGSATEQDVFEGGRTACRRGDEIVTLIVD